MGNKKYFQRAAALLTAAVLLFSSVPARASEETGVSEKVQAQEEVHALNETELHSSEETEVPETIQSPEEGNAPGREEQQSTEESEPPENGGQQSTEEAQPPEREGQQSTEEAQPSGETQIRESETQKAVGMPATEKEKEKPADEEETEKTEKVRIQIADENGSYLPMQLIKGPAQMTSGGVTHPVEYLEGVYLVSASEPTEAVQISLSGVAKEDKISITKWNGYLAEQQGKWLLCPDEPMKNAWTNTGSTYTCILEKFKIDPASLSLEQLAVYGSLEEGTDYAELFICSPEVSAVLLIRLGRKQETESETEREAGTETEQEIKTETEREAETEFLAEETEEVQALATVVLAAAEKDITGVYQAVGKNLSDLAAVYIPQVSSINGEWQILGLARSGQSVEDSVYSGYKTNLLNLLEEKNGVLHEKKYTEYSRVVLALTALGEDVTNVGGYNLLKPLSDFDQTVWQGINGAIFALLAFDSHNYEIPQAEQGKTQTTRERLIAYILDLELSGGGWALSGITPDPDITAMAIQSLAPYCKTNPTVKAAVDRGVNRLSAMQDENGGYGSWGQTNSESCSQVIVALTALGIDPNTDPRFVKNGKSVMDALLTYISSDGTFQHVSGGDSDQMATEQAYYALTSYQRLKEGKTSLYDMSDVQLKNGSGQTGNGDSPNGQGTTGTGNTGETQTESEDQTGGSSSGNKTAGGVTKRVNLVSSTQKVGGTAASSSLPSDGTVEAGKNGEESEAESESEEETEEAKLPESGATKAEDDVRTVIAALNTMFHPSYTDGGSAEGPSVYSEEEAEELVKIYLAVEKLSEEEQQTVKESPYYEEYIGALAKLGAENHFDEASGTDLRDNGEDILPWYVKVEVTSGIGAEAETEAVNHCLRGRGEVFSFRDICLLSLLDREEWQPEDILRVRLPLEDVGEYENVAVVHIRENGTMEFLEGHISGNSLEFDTDGFSTYGTVGFHGSLEELMEKEETDEIWFYAVPGAAAVLLLLILFCAKRRMGKKEEI
ncbi:MAG: prenyltransferase/squalene oxidase repeat-containing protein [Candidatus Choladocola sp.]|nr:prenyltransferase/squalene oxidase repeat-containing protein [Candidatus Choladocola sp.]